MHSLIPYFEPPALELPIPLPNGNHLTIHAFGVFVALGVVLGAQVAMKKAKKDGYDPEVINRFVTWIIVGIFVGGHLGHALFYEPQKYLENPWDLLKVWEGLSSMGGFIACGILSVIFFRLYRLPYWPYCDAIAVGLTLGWALGRMGCFSAHDHIGTETTFWLGVQGVCPGKEGTTIACHDVGLYEGLYSGLFLLPLFLYLDRKPRFPGFFVGMLMTLYGPIRFILDLFRAQGVDARYFGLTPGNYGAVVVSALGVWILVRQHKKAPMVIRVGDAPDLPPPAAA